MKKKQKENSICIVLWNYNLLLLIFNLHWKSLIQFFFLQTLGF